MVWRLKRSYGTYRDRTRIRGEILKENNINSFYLRSFIIILSNTLLTLIGIHYIDVVLILFPVLFIVNSIQDGLGEGVTNMVVTLIIISIVESLNVGLFLAISFAPFTIIISFLIKKRKGNAKILGFSSIVFFISILIMVVITKLLGVDIVKYIETTFRQLLDSQLESYESVGLSNYEFFRMSETLEDAYKQVLLFIPSIFLLISSVGSYISYWLSGIILGRLGIQIINIPKFSKFSLPKDIMPGSILMFGATFLIGKLGFSYYEAVFMNIGVLLMIGFFIQGLSVIDYFLNKLRFNLVLKIVFYITFIFNQSLISIITIIGLIDLIFDLRKIRKRRPL